MLRACGMVTLLWPVDYFASDIRHALAGGVFHWRGLLRPRHSSRIAEAMR